MALFMCVLRTNLLPSQACSKPVFNHSIKNQALQKDLDQLKIKMLQLLLSVWGSSIALIQHYLLFICTVKRKEECLRDRLILTA